jgi:hypothetical protein
MRTTYVLAFVCAVVMNTSNGCKKNKNGDTGGTNNPPTVVDPPGAPVQTWQEHWFEHVSNSSPGCITTPCWLCITTTTWPAASTGPTPS